MADHLTDAVKTTADLASKLVGHVRELLNVLNASNSALATVLAALTAAEATVAPQPEPVAEPAAEPEHPAA